MCLRFIAVAVCNQFIIYKVNIPREKRSLFTRYKCGFCSVYCFDRQHEHNILYRQLYLVLFSFFPSYFFDSIYIYSQIMEFVIVVLGHKLCQFIGFV